MPFDIPAEATLITTNNLKSQSREELAKTAKSRGVAGWNSMSKPQLIAAISAKMSASKSKPAAKAAPKAKAPPAKSVAKASAVKSTPKPVAKTAPVKAASKPAPSKAAAKSVAKPAPGISKAAPTPAATKPATNGATAHAGKNGVATSAAKAPAEKVAPPAPKPSPAAQKISAKIQETNLVRERLKDLSSTSLQATPATILKKTERPEKDRLVLMVRDCYWLHACWNVSRQNIARAEAALAEHWHTARPVLRVIELSMGQTTNAAEQVVREIEVHSGVTNWYIDVSSPPKSYRVDLGYLAANGRFYALARSNSVTTPVPGSADAIDQNWAGVAEDYERIYSMSGGYAEESSSGDLQELFEERLRRPMVSPLGSSFANGGDRAVLRQKDFQFEVDCEMILFGSTKPGAHVALAGEPVKLRPDGSFTIRLSLPDKRQVLPVVASSSDGAEQRTIVIAVERNTKILEPMVRESGE